MSIITYGAPWENQFQAIFNPVEISKDTLFVSKIKNENGKETKSTEKIELNPSEIDSLYTHFQKIKNNFNLNERKSRVLDGTSVSVSISNNTSAVHFSYKGLKKAENADPEIEKLIKFINTKLPNKFQIY